MSNIFDGPGKPTYLKPVARAPEREKQWKEIVSRGCDRRICTVFKNQEEVTAYLNALYKKSPPPEPPQEQGPEVSSSPGFGSFAVEFWKELGKVAKVKNYRQLPLDERCKEDQE